MNINSLIYKCLKNDRKAQFVLFDLFVKQVSQTCERYSNDLPTAKDHVQMTFIKVFKNLKSFDKNKGSFQAWIKRIAINECLMTFRKNKHLMLVAEITDNFKSIEYPDFGADIDIQILLKVVDKLPKGYRTVFLLNVVDGFSHKEIATQLNISENTSRTQLFKARKMLMDRLGKSMAHYKVS